jgi:hypothetical protein
MKKSLFCILSLFILLCNGECDDFNYTFEELNKKYNPDGLSPVGTHFWDEFASFKYMYNLNDAESGVLGDWSGFYDGSGFLYDSYCFFSKQVVHDRFNELSSYW